MSIMSLLTIPEWGLNGEWELISGGGGGGVELNGRIWNIDDVKVHLTKPRMAI